MKKTGIIYAAINKVNGKQYIGQTIQKLNSRIALHYREAKKYSHKFANALKKYNKNEWIWKILEKNIPIDKLDKLEVFYIKKLNSMVCGYNSTSGGQNRKAVSIETKNKISKSLKKYYEQNTSHKKGKKLSAKTKKLISANHADVKKNNHPMWNKNHSESAKSKISLAKKGQPSPRKGIKLSNDTKNQISNSLSVNEYIITTPEGFEYKIKNLKKYCVENNLNISSMYKVSYGQYKQYKGYKCRKL